MDDQKMDDDASRDSSFLRILNGALTGIVGLSVFAQLIGLAIARTGGLGAAPAGLRFLFGISSFALVPGMVLAFVMFLVSAVRCFRDDGARGKAAMYLTVVILPFVLARFAPQPVIQPAAAAAVKAGESEQFMVGYDWAKQQQSTRTPECRGSTDFNRGCRQYIFEQREVRFQAGSEWAKTNQPAKPSECRGAPNFILGCRTYFYKHLARPKPEGQGKYEGMTTAECVIEVNANFEAARDLDLQDGNDHSAAVTARKSWEPELRDCENYDKVSGMRSMSSADTTQQPR